MQKLSKNEQVLHALQRLTYGPRPGDFEAVRRMGVAKFVYRQLHPERIPENPELQEKLRPLLTLSLTPLEIWEKYPQQASIVMALKGKPALPDDPAFRETVLRYASFFKLDQSDEEKKNGSALLPSLPLSDFISDSQLNVLRSGKPDQKLEVLNSVPETEWDPFLAALDKNLRGQLQGIALVAMKRRIMMLNSPQQVLAYDLLSGKVERAIYSNRQLAEQLTDFWYNHFNVYLDKGNDRFLVPTYERDVIRPHVRRYSDYDSMGNVLFVLFSIFEG